MKRSFRSLFAHCLVLAFMFAPAAQGAEPLDPQRWEADIQAFERQDREHPPTPGGVLFVGSSSIVRWRLDEAFPELKALNRGFGGSEIADSVYYADRVILPYQPRLIVFYAGDNDIANGKSPQQVSADFARLAEVVHAALPETRILFLSIKPSRSRWKLVEEQREANRLISEQAKDSTRLEFVDVATPLLGEDGMPRDDLFEADELHINEAGYRVWNEILRPKLMPPGEQATK